MFNDQNLCVALNDILNKKNIAQIRSSHLACTALSTSLLGFILLGVPTTEAAQLLYQSKSNFPDVSTKSTPKLLGSSKSGLPVPPTSGTPKLPNSSRGALEPLKPSSQSTISGTATRNPSAPVNIARKPINVPRGNFGATISGGSSGVPSGATISGGSAGVHSKATVSGGSAGVPSNATVSAGSAGIPSNATVSAGSAGIPSNATVSAGSAAIPSNATVSGGSSGQAASAGSRLRAKPDGSQK